jgi:predicted ArsR family transcriptional regulator
VEVSKVVDPRALAAQVASIAALKDSTRRRLYLHVVDQVHPVGRDDAIQALGIGRTLAAFHLDRLVDAGLEVEIRPLSEQREQGGGRPAKLYRRASRPLGIALPERRYDLAGRLLARAMTEADPSGEVLGHVARQHGVDLAEAVRYRATEGTSTAEALVGVLVDYGFEP